MINARDVAAAHRLALQTNEPSGGRYLAASESAWMIEFAHAIRGRLGGRVWLVPRVELPDLAVRLIALVDGAARAALPVLGRDVRIDNSRARKALGLDFIPLSECKPTNIGSFARLPATTLASWARQSMRSLLPSLRAGRCSKGAFLR